MQSCRSSRAVEHSGARVLLVASEYLCSPTRCTFTVLQPELWLATSLSCDCHTGKARQWQMPVVSERHFKFKVQTPTRSQSQGKSRTDRPLSTRASSPRSPWAPRGPTHHLPLRTNAISLTISHSKKLIFFITV